MCGRMNVDDEVNDAFDELVGHPFPGASNVNTAPTEPVWVIRNRRSSDAGNVGTPSFEAAEAMWWLTPYWSKTGKPKYATFNAKAETLTTSSAFREPFARRRCVVPITGFYEWRKGDRRGRANAVRQPYLIRPLAGPMLLAGVWDRWRSQLAAGKSAADKEDAEVIESFAIVTTAVCPQLSFIHDRQPVMLSPEGARQWLSRETSMSGLETLMAPSIPGNLAAAPVSTNIGDPRNKERRCAAPIGNATLIGAEA